METHLLTQSMTAEDLVPVSHQHGKSLTSVELLTRSNSSKNKEGSCKATDKKTSASSSNSGVYESSTSITTGMEMTEDGEEHQVIQILLPCITCNRTFSPEALQRHSKVCTKVNTKDPFKPIRGTFDSTEQRIKGTKVADFIGPPSLSSTSDVLATDPMSSSLFSRRCRNRASLRGTSCTTRTNIGSSSVTNYLGMDQSNLGSAPTTAPWRRSRSLTRRSSEQPKINQRASVEADGDESSEYGSNNSDDSGSLMYYNRRRRSSSENKRLPSYAQNINPENTCPYCHRAFGIKAFDRHVAFCKDLLERKQYEIQAIPIEKEEALERQEKRTKYRPMRGSGSYSSLRSPSPSCREFSSLANKYFSGLKHPGFLTSQSKSFSTKRSNESIANSCYSEVSGMRRNSRSPVRHKSVQPSLRRRGESTSPPPLRINTSSNIRMKTRSSEALPFSSNKYSHVQSSGYGPNGSFMRNSRGRSSFQSRKDFFRDNKRVEPEGTENNNDSDNGYTNNISALIIKPMSLYNKSKYNEGLQENYLNYPESSERHVSNSSSELKSSFSHNNGHGNHKGRKLFDSQDPYYDPYEKAAKQLQELLKSKPSEMNSSGCEAKASKKSMSRRLGLERAFESVGVLSPDFSTNPSDSSLSTSEPKHLESTRISNDTSNDVVVNSRDTGKELLYLSPMNSNDESSCLDGTEGKNPNGIGTSSKESDLKSCLKVNNVGQPSVSGDEGKSIMSDCSLGSDVTLPNENDSNLTTNPSRHTSLSKPRAVSNVSSADSAFSRSEGTDLEFEALESLVNVGDMPNDNTQKKSKKSQLRMENVVNKDYNSVLSLEKKSHHRDHDKNENVGGDVNNFSAYGSGQSLNLGKDLPILRIGLSTSGSSQKAPTKKKESLYSGSHKPSISQASFGFIQKSPEIRFDHDHASAEFRQQKPSFSLNSYQDSRDLMSKFHFRGFRDNIDVNSNVNKNVNQVAKFCHECGAHYTTSTAKFCSQCGERRMI